MIGSRKELPKRTPKKKEPSKRRPVDSPEVLKKELESRKEEEGKGECNER